MRQPASLLLVAALLISCAPRNIAPENGDTVSSATSTAGVETQDVNYGPATGYLAVPKGDPSSSTSGGLRRAGGPFPALILIHEWWGLNDNIRWYAEEFAKKGYIALAVDLYGESTTDPKRAGELASSVRSNMEPAFANLRAAVDYLRSHPEVDNTQLASVGWCFGGGWSYQMAKNDLGVKASIMYYGQFAPEDDLSAMRAHIIGHFGEKDTGIPVDDVKAFRAKLETLSGEHQIFLYENEGHGFARELTTESAQTAWARTLEFLNEQL